MESSNLYLAFVNPNPPRKEKKPLDQTGRNDESFTHYVAGGLDWEVLKGGKSDRRSA